MNWERCFMVTSKHYDKGVFHLAMEDTAQVVEKGLTVGGKHMSIKPLEELGVLAVLSPFPRASITVSSCSFYKTWGTFSLVTTLLLECWNPAFTSNPSAARLASR